MVIASAIVQPYEKQVLCAPLQVQKELGLRLIPGTESIVDAARSLLAAGFARLPSSAQPNGHA